MSATVERFMKYVEKGAGDECWTWTGFRDRRGYGRFRVGSMRDGTRRKATAHRVSHELFIGPIPDGHFVCHHCDNPACVRPEHLYAGTAADNGRDVRVRGRAVGRHPSQSGALNPNYKHGGYVRAIDAEGDLTDRQRQALTAIHGHLLAHQRPPTLRELGRALGIRSTNGVSELLTALEKKGAIQRDAGIPRGIRVLKTG